MVQSNYIPWKGYFDLIRQSDVFVFYDHVQYTKNDWRNRNYIKSRTGKQWLSIPIKHISLNQKISEVEVAWDKWNIKHWKTIRSTYAKSKHFSKVSAFIEPLYLDCKLVNLSAINQMFLRAVCQYLEIGTKLENSGNFQNIPDRNMNIIQICKNLGAGTYISGSSAKSYIDEQLFREHSVELSWINYDNYPQYPQLHEPFDHHVSILDLLFNVGKDSIKYISST